MRSLLRLVACVLLALSAAAQTRHVRLELEDGRTVEGRVLEITPQGLTVEVGGVACTFANGVVRSADFQTVVDPEPEPEPNPPAAGTEPRPHGPVRRAPVRQSPVRAPAPGPRLLLHRLEQLDGAYPWLAPADPVQGISLAVLALALLSLILHTGTRLVAPDPPSFGASLGLSLVLVVATAVEAALLPDSQHAIVVALGVDALLAAVLIRAMHKLPFGAALVATLLVVVQGVLLFGVIELIDTMLRSVGNTAY